MNGQKFQWLKQPVHSKNQLEFLKNELESIVKTIQ
jgi:hypothetical protein